MLDDRPLPGFHLQHVGDQIAVQQDGALGDAGGAAGILQEGDVVGAEFHPLERQLAAGGERGLEGGRAGYRVGRHHLLDAPHHQIDQGALHRAEHVAHAGDHHVLHLGLRQRLLQHAGEILQHHDGLGAGIVELEFQLARLVERIDVHHRAAGAQDGGDRHRILQHVRHHDGDAGAALEALALQPGGEGARGLVELAIGHGLAHAGEGVLAAIGLEAFLEHRHQRRIERRVDVGGDARRIMLQPRPIHDVSPCRRFRSVMTGGRASASNESRCRARLLSVTLGERSSGRERWTDCGDESRISGRRRRTVPADCRSRRRGRAGRARRRR